MRGAADAADAAGAAGAAGEARGTPAAPPAAAAPAARHAGLGLGWTRVADALRQHVPAAEIHQIWLFPPVRREEREWGTAVVARRVAADRLRLYTAGYMLIIKGRERGQGRVQVEPVGESPDAVVPEVLRGVQERAGEAGPPVEVDVAVWYPEPEDQAADDEPAPQG